MGGQLCPRNSSTCFSLLIHPIQTSLEVGAINFPILQMKKLKHSEIRSFVWVTRADGLPRRHSGKEFAHQGRRCERHGFDPWLGKIPWRRKWQPTPVFLPGKFHGQRSLVGYSSQNHKESDMTEQTHGQLKDDLGFRA